MTITADVCGSFKIECLRKEHDVDNDTFKIALFTSAATLNEDTTAYSATNEVSGTGYTAGGQALTGVVSGLTNAIAHIDFDDPAWAAATITARGALIYNSSVSNKAVAVIDFGEDISASNETFTVNVPVAGDVTGAIRLA